MFKQTCFLAYLCLFPCLSYANSADGSEDVDDQYLASSNPWREAEDNSPRTNPRWYRNPEAREAYLRGESDYRSYPRQKNGNEQAYYRRTGQEVSADFDSSSRATEDNDSSPRTNPRWYRNPRP